MMRELDPKETVVDRSSCASIKGAKSVDLEANQVLIHRRNVDGTEENVTLYYPSGISVVRHR